MCARGGDILLHYHDREARGHFGATRTAPKALKSSFYCLTLFKDAPKYVSQCNRCQMIGNISRKYEMPLDNILVCDLFDV